MRPRGLSIGVLGIALAAAGLILAWPSLSPLAAGAIADRLARETGLAWHVGGLGLDPAPGLVLRDVGFDGAGVAGRLDAVRVTGPIGLVWGGAGTLEARIAGVRLTLPLAPPPDPAAAGDASPGRLGVRALRAVLHGAVAAAGDGGRTVSLAASAVDLSLDVAAAAGDPAVRVEMPDRGVVAEIEAAPRAAARLVRLTLAPEGGPRVAGSARARLEAGALHLDGIAGTIDHAAFTGSVSAEHAAGAVPRVSLDLKLDALALADTRADAAADLRADPVAGLTVPVRADRVPDPAWFSGYAAHASVSIQRLAAGPLRASAVVLDARVEAGRLDAALVSATLYQGGARGRYVLEPDGRHQLGLSLAGVRVMPLMRDAAGVDGLDGSGSARLDVQAQAGIGPGATLEALSRAASGQAEASVIDGRIDGIDLARAAGLTSLGGGLATRLDRLGGHFAIGAGRAQTDDLQLRTGLIEADGTGELDLAARTIDLRLNPLAVTAGGRFDVPIRVSGPWDAPAVTADWSGLARDPGGALQGLQNLGSSLLGDDGGGRVGRDPGAGLGGLLDGLMPPRDRARGRPR